MGLNYPCQVVKQKKNGANWILGPFLCVNPRLCSPLPLSFCPTICPTTWQDLSALSSYLKWGFWKSPMGSASGNKGMGSGWSTVSMSCWAYEVEVHIFAWLNDSCCILLFLLPRLSKVLLFFHSYPIQAEDGVGTMQCRVEGNHIGWWKEKGVEIMFLF